MDGDRQMFPGVVRAVALTAWQHDGEGWSVTVNCRREFEGWDANTAESYERLTLGELLDALGAAVTAAEER